MTNLARERKAILGGKSEHAADFASFVCATLHKTALRQLHGAQCLFDRCTEAALRGKRLPKHCRRGISGEFGDSY